MCAGPAIRRRLAGKGRKKGVQAAKSVAASPCASLKHVNDASSGDDVFEAN